MNAALVPVKRLGTGKSRLLPRLGRDTIERLSLAMLADVLGALGGVPQLAAVAVVTEDPAVAEAAQAAGARALVLVDEGLNPSLERAGATLAAEGASALLVVLGDVAGARSAELCALFDALDALGGRGAVLAPARDGGTGALLRAPPDAIPAAFGPGSAARHRALAKASGVGYRELALPSLAVDLDSPEDVEAFLRDPGEGTHTAALLRALDRGEASE